MTVKLLYIEASPRKENSSSSRVAKAFVDAYQQANPDHEVEHLPLFDIELPLSLIHISEPTRPY